ncbi:MAG: hypothetical protein ABL977_11890 [Candidatus Eisenbacteria bacterium]
MLTSEDRALLERLARRVAELRMETPAILTLETARPLSLVASQAMLFFEPFAQMLFRFDDYRRLAQLVERRDALEALTVAIEQAAEERETAARSTAPHTGERS